MACYTLVLVKVEDTEINRRARANLGLPETGDLTVRDAARVRKESGLLKTQQVIRNLNPTAVVRRQGDKLTISVNV